MVPPALCPLLPELLAVFSWRTRGTYHRTLHLKFQCKESQVSPFSTNLLGNLVLKVTLLQTSMEALKFNRFLLNSLVSTFPNYFTFISSSFTPLFVLMVSSSPMSILSAIFLKTCASERKEKLICLYYRRSPPNVLLRHLLN